ncbi:MAG: hypothetical protein AAFX93_14195 [Verrucomicrobiota bacterium]
MSLGANIAQAGQAIGQGLYQSGQRSSERKRMETILLAADPDRYDKDRLADLSFGQVQGEIDGVLARTMRAREEADARSQQLEMLKKQQDLLLGRQRLAQGEASTARAQQDGTALRNAFAGPVAPGGRAQTFVQGGGSNASMLSGLLDLDRRQTQPSFEPGIVDAATLTNDPALAEVLAGTPILRQNSGQVTPLKVDQGGTNTRQLEQVFTQLSSERASLLGGFDKFGNPLTDEQRAAALSRVENAQLAALGELSKVDSKRAEMLRKAISRDGVTARPVANAPQQTFDPSKAPGLNF